ncbi:Hypothetical predicted protein [Marmota monax]|uniref:Dolichyl-diphosphooligosaccharide--protein glycosyltransferase subunit 4 n=1 Tax=Marmota monax TaxID=9995 RepID=A0A5E4A8G0_MARMO|nr:dolichyl-diphosphooligosaccharide--protein glycosyltransferase subunit 4 [Marmota monax]VTJ53428.1 Hypothetical predicted protein [Marmota monax]
MNDCEISSKLVALGSLGTTVLIFSLRMGKHAAMETKLTLRSSGPSLLPPAGTQAASERSRAGQDDHRRSARHLRQHAGRVAILACGSLSLRGRQQSQEAGMKVALSPPQGSRT